MDNDEHEKSCKLCEVTKKVYGDRFGGCGDIANQIALDVVNTMKVRLGMLVVEAERKLANGTITKEEYGQITHSLVHSFPYAAGIVPAMALMAGADSTPIQMMEFVQHNMVRMVQVALMNQGKEDGMEGVLSVLRGMSKTREEEPTENPDIDPSKMN